MYSFLAQIFRHSFMSLKTSILFFTKIENIALVKSQLEILALGLKIFGAHTKFQLFNDCANQAISLAKTIDTVIDGQPEEKRQAFIKAINEAKGNLIDVNVDVDTKEGISLKVGSVKGSINFIDKSVKVGKHWKI